MARRLALVPSLAKQHTTAAWMVLIERMTCMLEDFERSLPREADLSLGQHEETVLFALAERLKSLGDTTEHIAISSGRKRLRRSSQVH
jgi:hypothetical protein